MKNVLRRNINVLLIVFIVLFTALIGYLWYVTATFGERWFVTPYNPRIQNMQTTVDAGDIYDRAGRELLYTSGESRKYISDKDRRAAVSHIVGDGFGLTYGAQTNFAKYLYGFDKNTLKRIEDLVSGNERQGNDIVLTIDAKLSEVAYDALDGNRGAVVVMNYKTGEILASVSSPTFDPNDMSLFLEGGGESELVNRAFVGLYPPGSIFKLITAAAMIENDMTGFTTHCDGSIVIDGQEIGCWDEHGDIDFEGAIAHSCNVYFAQATQELSARKINETAQAFLFNKQLLFDDVIMGTSVYEMSGDEVNVAWSAIGQYHDLITPLHACMIAGAIANDGVMMEPKLLKEVVDKDAVTYVFTPAVAARPSSDTVMLKQMMIACVQSGTGRKAAIDGYVIAGKTGTAEITGDEENAEHAWFVGFVDDEEHPIAIAVIMERAGSGASKAAPAARKVLDAALDIGY
jgi:peptidoglycan glycosyltransferase